MAQILEEIVVIKLSRLVKSGETAESVVTSEIIAALEQVVQELVGSGVIVEVEAV